jgi:hypothetical protein
LEQLEIFHTPLASDFLLVPRWLTYAYIHADLFLDKKKIKRKNFSEIRKKRSSTKGKTARSRRSRSGGRAEEATGWEPTQRL